MLDGQPVDPIPYLLNGSINVLTTFLLGVHYKLEDEKFQTVSRMTKDLLRNLMGYVQAKMTASITPKWLIRMRWFRKIKMRIFPKYREMCELHVITKDVYSRSCSFLREPNLNS